MDAFIRGNQTLIFSTLYMLFSLLVAGYSIFYSRMETYGLDLRVATDSIQSSNPILARKVASLSKKEKVEDVGIRYLPTFLARINEIAHNNLVIIRDLFPDKSGTLLKFSLKFVSNYTTFLRFTSELESLDILLDDIQVHPYDTTGETPLHAISFTLIPQNNADPISGKRLNELKENVQAKNKRNPFQRLDYDRTRKVVRPAIDLTWIYKLEGLGTTKENKPYANINRRHYQIGDKLDGRVIDRIDNSQVYLKKETRDGVTNYMLKFRKANKK